MASGPSKAQIIRDLAIEGLRPIDIVEQTGFRYDYVRHQVASARRKGAPIKEFVRAAEPFRVRSLTYETRLRLRQEAARRNMSAAQLGSQILQAVMMDDMVDAVLDTGGDDE